MDAVPHISSTVSAENLVEDAKGIALQVKKEWPSDKVCHTAFKDGITNKLFSFYLESDTNRDNAVLVRVFGENTDVIIDRIAEKTNMFVMHKEGLGQPLYATFNNGLAYRYQPGRPVTVESVRFDKVSKLIVEQIVSMGAIDVPGKARQPFLFTKLFHFLDLVPVSFPCPKKQSFYEQRIMSKSQLMEEASKLKTMVSPLSSPIVFCHNDLLLGNIIHDERNDQLRFIDYEYGDYNYQAFEIADHFCEFVGIDNIDFNNYPDKPFQMKWLRWFLQAQQAFEKGKGFDYDKAPLDGIEEEAVESLYRTVNKFALCSHFFWGVWAIIQAAHSTIDFDFLEYASIKLDEYLAKRDQFMAL